MQRYFLEVSYIGKGYAGFQLQQNANTIQGEVERALQTFFRKPVSLTGSSRTDAGVNALQNFFHADAEAVWDTQKTRYHLNAILPSGIAIRAIHPVHAEAHCRFDATSRLYRYRISREKDPFEWERACYFPYALNMRLLKEAAAMVLSHTHFEAFSKRNTQVNNFVCTIMKSEWKEQQGILEYEAEGNRFLRGMVRGLVGTMLNVGREKMSIAEFAALLEGGKQAGADFSVPGHGLYLVKVNYPLEGIFA